jgi:hypothetical protein
MYVFLYSVLCYFLLLLVVVCVSHGLLCCGVTSMCVCACALVCGWVVVINNSWLTRHLSPNVCF